MENPSPYPELDAQPQTRPSSPPPEFPTEPSVPASSRRRWIWIILGSLFLLCLVCGGIAGLLAYRGARTAMGEKGAAEDLLDRYMQSMVRKDVAASLELFTNLIDRSVIRAQLEKSTTGNNYVLFAGYRSLRIESLNVNVNYNSNPNVLQGKTLTIHGSIDYDRGFQGRFESILHEEDGK